VTWIELVVVKQRRESTAFFQ